MKLHADKASPLQDYGCVIPGTIFVFFINAAFKLGGSTSEIASQFGF